MTTNNQTNEQPADLVDCGECFSGCLAGHCRKAPKAEAQPAGERAKFEAAVRRRFPDYLQSLFHRRKDGDYSHEGMHNWWAFWNDRAMLEEDAQRSKLTSDQSVTSDYMEWANDRDSVGGNEAWNAGVEWAKAQRPSMNLLTDEQYAFLNFLYGEVPLDGVWFGDCHHTDGGYYWWRKHLRRVFDVDGRGIK